MLVGWRLKRRESATRTREKPSNMNMPPSDRSRTPASHLLLLLAVAAVLLLPRRTLLADCQRRCCDARCTNDTPLQHVAANVACSPPCMMRHGA